MPQYQQLSLLQTNFGNKRNKTQKVNSSLGGTPLDDPKSVATQEEYDDFNLRISTLVTDGESMATPLDPPIFRFMQQKGDIAKVPHEAHFLAQDGSKGRGQCFRFAQNADFVSIPDDYEFGSGYHAIDDQGDGYKISNSGEIQFPVVYYVHKGGFVISCQRFYRKPKAAKGHVVAGTADILGRRTSKKRCRGGSNEYRYFVRTYQIHGSGKHVISQRRSFYGANHAMDGSNIDIELGAIMLTSFVGPRPKGFIVQHDDECWNNALECIRWIPRRENYIKENLDPL